MMNECRESDSFIVSGKPSNKIRDNKRMAEEVEKRRLAKGNLNKQNKSRTQRRGILQSELDRIRQVPESQGVCASLPEAGAQCGSSACLGSVRGAPGNRHSYRDHMATKANYSIEQRTRKGSSLVRSRSAL